MAEKNMKLPYLGIYITKTKHNPVCFRYITYGADCSIN